MVDGSLGDNAKEIGGANNTQVEDDLCCYVVENPDRTSREYVRPLPQEYVKGKPFAEYAKTNKVYRFDENKTS